MRLIDADLLIQDAIQEYARSKQYRDAFTRMVNKAPTIEPKTKVVAQVRFDEEKLREIVKEAVERFKEEYEIEPKRGEWIWSPRDTDGTVSGCCSNCSFSHLFIGGHTAQYNFCPNCGAQMKGADDE